MTATTTANTTTTRTTARGWRGALVLAVLLGSTTAQARTGMGDPVQPWREKDPDEWLSFRGHLRLRSALMKDLDLQRGPSSDGSVLWPRGDEGLTTGHDLRLRLSPSIFLGDSVRLFVEIDVLDNVALGARPRFAPFGGRPALVAASPFQEPLSALDGAFRVRTAMAEAILPVAVVSAGRMPSHFGLGIAANDGNALDDDLGDRADRVAVTVPIFGHIVSGAFDVGSSGPSGQPLPGYGPAPRNPLVGEQSLSLAFLRFHAPWEQALLRDDGRVVVDYGVAGSVEWQDKDVPGYYVGFDDALGRDPRAVVERGYRAGVLDGWLRIVTSRLRLEAEVVGSMFTIQNASPYPGITLRDAVSGAPFGGVVVIEAQPLADRETLSLLWEAGFASSDPAPGLPLVAPTAFAGARPGDVFGSQLDGSRDTRMDAFRLHPLHRVDLILWRTLLGGVSEAAYARMASVWKPAQDICPGLSLESNVIYSHALDAASAPGGRQPLGVEVDGAIVIPYEAFSVRVDGGLLVPLGGLGARGQSAPALASMLLVRLGYAL
jgi:uncharacterized protein (TIGR04551 family)